MKLIYIIILIIWLLFSVYMIWNMQEHTKDIENDCDSYIDILIGTIPRPGNAPYLKNVISSILLEQNRPEMITHCMRINIFNVRPEDDHPVLDSVIEQYPPSSQIRYFSLDTEEFRNEVKTLHGGVPCELGICLPLGKYVQQDTRDRSLDFAAIVHYMLYSKHEWSDIQIILEDDFYMCPITGKHLARIIQYTNDNIEDISIVRFSHGFNGIVVQKRDMKKILEIIGLEFNNLPLDDMLGSFWTKNTRDGDEYYKHRVPITYRYNIMNHRGKETTLPSHDADDKVLNPKQCMIQLDKSLFKKFQLYWDPSVDPEGVKSEFFDEKRLCKEELDFSGCHSV